MTPAVADPPNLGSSVRDPGSFRDPSGFVFRRDGRLLRQINQRYADHWDALVASGFLSDLVEAGLLVPFETLDAAAAADPSTAHALIAPEALDFISYPYEWTFSQLQDAALLTLDIQARAAKAGFTLKDASAYNVQFRNGRPILIDTLSFETATPGAPWIAYRQFCQHFLAPLALMAYRDVRLGTMLREHLDGLPLDLTSGLLPGRTRLRFGLLSHIHFHARAERRYDKQTDTDTGAGTGSGSSGAGPSGPKMSDVRRAALIDSLRSATSKLSWDPGKTEWADYASNTSYTDAATADKDRVVREMVAATSGSTVWDLGANTGRFSRIAADLGKRVLAFDIDPGAAELHYRAVRREGQASILPLVGDVANPSPGLGWAGAERQSLADRSNADVTLSLALVHHLAIGRNVPLPDIAGWFARLAPEAIVEFVPKDDPMVRFLLSSREDVFPDYTLEGFRAAMATVFETVTETRLAESPRTMFHLRRR
jgi:ribosomal protein L11 methylase PrmA